MKKIKFPSIKEIQEWLLNLPIIHQSIEWSKKHSLPGFFKVPIYDVFVFVYNEIRRFDLFTRANAIAFSFFIALFPSLIMLFTLLPLFQWIFLQYLPTGDTFETFLFREINNIMPGKAGEILFSFVNEIANPNERQVGLFSFGFILSIYFSSNGMLAMMRSFEKSYQDTFKKRTGLKKRLVAIALTFLLGTLLFAAFVLIIIGNLVIDWLADFINLDGFTTFAITLLKWISIILIYYLGIGILYRYGAATIRRFHLFSPGVTLATFLSLAISVAFSFYIDEFDRYQTYYTKFYGSFAAIILIMLWIQLNSLILLIGFELNASIAVNRDLKETPKELDE